MSARPLSRREALQTLGGAVVATALGTQGSAKLKADSEIIDTHIHVARSGTPGGFTAPVNLAPFAKDDAEGLKRLARTVEEELKKARVSQALCMPRIALGEKDPLGIQATLAVAEQVQGAKLHPVGLAHPERFDRDHMALVEEVLKEGKVKALKAYLGYLHYEAISPGYRLYFKLAAKYKIPVIFHTGDPNSRTAKVKYAHPLQIDELAVDYPETKFVIAHFGNPWLLDAAQVLYKNKNVWVDLSAILIGNAEAFAEMEKEGVLERTAKRIKEAIEYSEAPDRFLFASDWPLSPIATYRDFVRRLFPERHHAAVFSGTAKALFGL